MNIAFYGPMCSGKTYLAKFLVENYEYQKLGFADTLKNVSKMLFDIDPTKKDDRTRKLLQGFSDDIKKWGGEDIFVKHFLNQIENIDWAGPVVCDDLRFTFEADALREIGFKIIGVNAYENIRQERILKLYPDTSLEAQQHRSETDAKLIEPDYIVWSNKPDDVKDLEALLNGKRATASVRR